MFDFLFFIVLIFIVISWIGGAAGKANRTGTARSKGSFSGYQKSADNSARYAAKPTQSTGSADWLSQLQNLESKLTQAARSAVPAGRDAGRSNVQNRFNNSPVDKSTFHNHSDSRAYLLDEMTESKVLWARNHQEMDRINQAFRAFVDHQHQENQRMMQDARSLDR